MVDSFLLCGVFRRFAEPVRGRGFDAKLEPPRRSQPSRPLRAKRRAMGEHDLFRGARSSRAFTVVHCAGLRRATAG